MTSKKTNLTTAEKNKHVSKIIIVLITAFFGICLACENSSLKENNNAAQGTPEKKVSEFERDLETMRTANFDYVFVFRRKDGGAFDAEDKIFLNADLPKHLINRVIVSDDDKAVIAGSNYKVPPESLEGLRKRFDIQDYSTKKENE